MDNEIKVRLSMDGASVVTKDLEAVARGMVNAGTTIDGVGISAKQTAFALRGLPAQFTDIVVSLQAGQAPLTVLLQQGGQLKDMFGGVGNAARAMGTYVLGLINPFTATAAAVGVLAYAAHEGSAEMAGFEKAVTLTGNAIGLSESQFSAMSQSMKGIATQGKAAEVLTEIASSGRFAGDSVANLAEAAILMEKATGQAVGETIKQFVRLADEPAKASAELNKQYNYLTASVYEQIKALEDQGNKVAAANLADITYAAAVAARANSVVSSAGLMERAWNSLAGAAKGAWDAMKDVDRPITNSDNIATLEAQLMARQERNATLGIKDGKATLDLQAQIAALKGVEAGTTASAAAQREYNNTQTAGQVAIDAVTKANDKAASKQVQMNKALDEYRKSISDIRAANPGSVLLDPKKVAAAEAGIRKQFKDTASPKEQITAYDRLMKAISEKTAVSQLDIETQARLTDGEKISAKVKADLLDGTLKMTPAQKALYEVKLADYILLEKSNIAQAKVTKAYEEDQAARAKYTEGISSGLDKLQADTKAQQDHNDRLGLGKEAIAQLDAASLELQATKLDGLAIDRLVQYQDTINYQTLKDQAQELRNLAVLKGQGAAKEAQVEADKSMLADWTKTVETYNDVFRTGFADMVNNGASAWGSFTKSLATTFKTSVADQIYKMFAQPFVMRLVASLIGVGGGALGLAGSASASQGGGVMGSLSVVQSLKGVYDTISTGFAGMTASTSGYLQHAADWMMTSQSTTLNSMGETLSANVGSISSAVGIAAGAAAGLAIGTAISGEYGSSGTVIAGTAIGAAVGSIVPVIGTAVGAALGGAIGGLVNRMFGMGNTEVQSSGMRGTFSQSGFAGNNYANMHQSGGWFRSDKNWTETSALAAGVAESMTKSFVGTKAAVAQVAVSLGLSIDTILSYSKNIDLAAGTTAEQMTAMFLGMADDMAKAAAPGLAALAKEGEPANVTLSRLSTSLTTSNAWLSLLQQRLFQVSLAGGDAASKLADAFGGLSNLTAASKAFYETYYTEGERAARSQEDMASALAMVNLAMPSTKDELRALAGTLDRNTESGRRAYAVLLAIAPEFAATADTIVKLAGQTAVSLMKAFTGGGRLIPALNVAALKVGDFTGAATSLSGELSYINSIMGDSTSAVIGFSNGAYVLGTNLSDSQVSAGLLSEQIYGLKSNSDKTIVNFAQLKNALLGVDSAPVVKVVADVNGALGAISVGAVAGAMAMVNKSLDSVDTAGLVAAVDQANTALKGVNTETFVATMALVFENLASRIQGIIGDISTERIAVRDAALSIINPTVMSKTQIERGIAGINTVLPGNGGVASANAALVSADATAAYKKMLLDRALAAGPSTAAMGAATAARDAATSTRDAATAALSVAKDATVVAEGANTAAQAWLTARLSEGWDPERLAIQDGAVDVSGAAFTLNTSVRNQQTAQSAYDTAQSAYDTQLAAYSAAVSVNAAQIAAAQAALNTAQAQLSAATTAQSAAKTAAKNAVIDYSSALQSFAIDASKSVGKLTKLREETVKYYEAQKALAGLMETSAAGIRSTISAYTFSQKTDEQKFQDLAGQFSKAYTLSKVTTGEALAGYGDKINALINPMIESLKATGRDNLIGSYLAQAEAVAVSVDSGVLSLGNYQQDSLGMLGSIDATLAALDASSQSAEKIISDAVRAGSDKTAAGLHAVIAALTGQAVPAFATGGAFTNGIVSRPTAFNMGMMGEAGDEGILPLANIGGRLGVHARIGGGAGGNTARLEALIERQGQQLEAVVRELAAIRNEAAGTNVSAGKMVKQADRIEAIGLPVRSLSGSPLATVAAV